MNPYLELRFKGIINNPLQTLEFSPLVADFGEVPLGKKSKISVNLTNTDSTESRIKIIDKPSPDLIKVNVKKKNLKPDASTKIEFSLTNKVPAGAYSTSLTLEAEGKLNSRVSIPINVLIQNKSKASK